MKDLAIMFTAIFVVVASFLTIVMVFVLGFTQFWQEIILLSLGVSVVGMLRLLINETKLNITKR